MQLIFGGAVILLCGYIGIAICDQYRKKKNIYRSLVTICQEVKSNLTYMKKPLRETLYTVLPGLSRDVSEYRKYTLTIMENPYLALAEPYLSNLLTREENEDINGYFVKLGCSDAANELKRTEVYYALFREKLKEAEAEYRKLGTSTVKIGLAVGVLLAILAL